MRRLSAREGGLTAATMAKIGQDDLAHVLGSIHWNKVTVPVLAADGAAVDGRLVSSFDILD